MSKTPVDTTLYDLLEVTYDADEKTLKKAYRTMALKWHPDRWSSNNDDEKAHAEDMFKKCDEAYKILSDPKKRQVYDRHGLAAAKGDGPRGMGMTEEDLHEMMQGMGFTGGFPFGGARQKKKEVRFPNIVHLINVTLIDTYIGKKVTFEVVRYLLKDKQPKKEDLICPDCKGVGSRIQIIQVGPGMMSKSENACGRCNTTGLIFPDEFFEKTTQKMSKEIPRGIMDGETIVIENRGHDIPACFKDQFPGQTKSDIELIIEEERTTDQNGYTFSRGANKSPFNLSVGVTITPVEAICGTYKPLTFLDGSKFAVKIPPGFIFEKNNKAIVVPRKGMPFYKQKDHYGDLFVIPSVSGSYECTEDQTSKIWKILTGNAMKSDHDKMIAEASGITVNAMTLDEYRESKAFKESMENLSAFDRQRRDENDDDMDEMGGDVPNCRQM